MDYEGFFEFFCKPTKTADNKKTIVELVADYKLEDFIKIQKLWDQPVRVSFVKEELKDSEDPISYDFQLFPAPKVNKGSKDTKTFTVYLTKSFEQDKHIILDGFLHSPVYCTFKKNQPDIDFQETEEKSSGVEEWD